MTLEMLRDIFALRRRSFILLSLLVLADLALALYLSLWQQPQLEQTQKEWFAKRDAQTRGLDRGVTARYQDNQRDLGLFRERIIPKKEFAGFLSELLAFAKSNSLALKGISYKPTQLKEPGLVSYDIGFNVSGRYAGVKSFIADLARYPKLVTIDSVSLGNGSPTEEAVDLKVQLTVLLKLEGA